MTATPFGLALRRCTLAVCVLHDIDLRPTLGGIILTQTPQLRVSWAECRRAVGGADPDGELARSRLARWLSIRRWVAAHPLDQLATLARPYGVPVDSELHPGLDWVRLRVLGDALDVGLAFAGLDPQRPEAVIPVPDQLLVAAGVDASPWWARALVYLEEMGGCARERYLRDPATPLRPMGDCDVVTLLASRTLRCALVEGFGGMRTAAAPMRVRGWLDLSRIDPAYVLAAAALTDVEHRGFSRPLLLTADEVAAAAPGGHPAELVLRDPAVNSPFLRSMLYR
ncbi:MAG: hypothetical protein ACYCO3_11740 [Mycobacteriales bacterium]